MATLSDGVFRFLSLCAQPPGSASVAQRLPSALAAVSSFDELAIAAEQHGMEPLVLAHIDRTGLAIPDDVRTRLRARRTQHAHAAAIRTRVIADVASAMAQVGVPFLVLKGAALAHLVYGDSGLRPMRDVDLLIRKADAGRARDVLTRCGFSMSGAAVPSHHHHLRGMARTRGWGDRHHRAAPRAVGANTLRRAARNSTTSLTGLSRSNGAASPIGRSGARTCCGTCMPTRS